MGHPVLRRIADPVDPAIIGTDNFQRFCDDLLDTLYEYDGAGLAAPQVHESIRVALIVLDDEIGPEFFVNPVITPLSDSTTHTWEGCLSVEGIRGRVERPDHIKVEFVDRHGQRKAYELQGFPAVVVQHECDHLDGVLYIDRADPLSLAFLSEYRKFGPLVGNDDIDLEEQAHFDADDQLTEEEEQHGAA